MNRTIEKACRQALALALTIFFAIASVAAVSPAAAKPYGRTIGLYLSQRCSGPVDYSITDNCASALIQIAEGEHSAGHACIPQNFTEAQIAVAMLQYLRVAVANHSDGAGNETTMEMAKAAHALWPCQ